MNKATKKQFTTINKRLNNESENGNSIEENSISYFQFKLKSLNNLIFPKFFVRKNHQYLNKIKIFFILEPTSSLMAFKFIYFLIQKSVSRKYSIIKYYKSRE